MRSVISFVRKPVSPMVANPISVTTGLFWDSFLSDLVHLLTSQIVSFTKCRCCSTTAFPEPRVLAGWLFERQYCHFTTWALLIHEHGKSLHCLVYHSIYFLKSQSFIVEVVHLLGRFIGIVWNSCEGDIFPNFYVGKLFVADWKIYLYFM